MATMDLLDQLRDELADLGRSGVRAAPRLVLGILLVAAVFAVARIVGRLVARVCRRFSEHPYLSQVMDRLAHTLVVVAGLLVATAVVFPSFTPASLVQLLGISSVAVGFAFKDIFQNFLAGILILLTRPFRIGDEIAFDRYEGTVEDIQTRATLMTTYDGMRVVIPNANLFTNAVLVRTAYPRRRLHYTAPFKAGDDLAAVRGRMRGIIAATPGVLAEPPPEVLLIQREDDSLHLEARWWIDTPLKQGAMAARDQVLSALSAGMAPPTAAPAPTAPAPVPAPTVNPST
jgi:small conductance mechanosensitive channel